MSFGEMQLNPSQLPEPGTRCHLEKSLFSHILLLPAAWREFLPEIPLSASGSFSLSPPPGGRIVPGWASARSFCSCPLVGGAAVSIASLRLPSVSAVSVPMGMTQHTAPLVPAPCHVADWDSSFQGCSTDPATSCVPYRVT